MTARDLTQDDVDGFLLMHAQRAEETRFAQLEDEWTPATTLEDVAILLGVFCICLGFTLLVGYGIWKVVS